ncbi:PGF-pre-PGF domain-containing protein [Candidatus Woesearchaeota archaeon]|nr:PGF-pre-PGF domain-containing protein [Candidatus Woesearchaeota archaeon]MBT4387168.1 PGF-pre-PGF domain-containing protein [Candidatus Woesearchaeota archaeon]MBT4596075.1 PGF-pre-PGF domain-containing protein [Candidatus Woesearchaeota archaeon]MBT5741703.1 PGF-pre-PGF domain-containing protein [Candidatus Woesearchaeota archaeon]MBT7849080.1 PGF-pre-PGF domain-containing protein [Candidatus Woesearchaeota archaeon]
MKKIKRGFCLSFVFSIMFIILFSVNVLSIESNIISNKNVIEDGSPINIIYQFNNTDPGYEPISGFLIFINESLNCSYLMNGNFNFNISSNLCSALIKNVNINLLDINNFSESYGFAYGYGSGYGYGSNPYFKNSSPYSILNFDFINMPITNNKIKTIDVYSILSNKSLIGKSSITFNITKSNLNDSIKQYDDSLNSIKKLKRDENIISTSVKLINFYEGETKSIIFTKIDLPITKIKITTNADKLTSKVSAALLKEKPEDILSVKSNIIDYLELDVSIPKNYINDAVICFKVEKSDLNKYNIDQNDINLFRYVDDEWEQLDTFIDKIFTDSNIYCSVTLGFSYFAIGQNIDKYNDNQLTTIDNSENKFKPKILIKSENKIIENLNARNTDDINFEKTEINNNNNFIEILIILILIFIVCKIFYKKKDIKKI